MGKCLFAIIAAGALLCCGVEARAAYPERTVQIIVGFAPGGTTDALARILAQKLGEKWGQPVVVVNRPGADGRVGAEYVSASKPDGYTILVLVNDNTLPDPPGVKVSFDVVKSFTPVVLLATLSNCLVVNTALPAHTVKDVATLTKAQPDKMNFSANSTGSPGELAWQRFLTLTGTKMGFLRYVGSTPMLTAVISGEAQITIVPCANIISHMQNNEVLPIAISQKTDLPLFAKVPTFEEASGLKNYDGGGGNWYGFVVPAGTPKATADKIRQDAIAVMSEPDVQQRLLNQLVFPNPGASQDDFVKLIQSDIVRWAAWSKENETLVKKP